MQDIAYATILALIRMLTFKESKNRILSMALIHEILCLSEDFGRIDFNSYVKNLISDLFMSYGIGTDRITVKIDVADLDFRKTESLVTILAEDQLYGKIELNREMEVNITSH